METKPVIQLSKQKPAVKKELLPDNDYMASVIVDRITEFYTRPE